ncbi:uncharacterized protein LOC115881932 [Sitophilus oryzae]|uniref:Uncharacterized protein LOC115881932 n=1 Tax=Sitophilus oryzae TaxID=7048 RepID=A0A6J2XVG1_SITOR|nr:uncharacterized protein LOC115881932 [Sitophilus oryzae]
MSPHWMSLTEELIECVKAHPILYDRRNEDYKNSNKRDKVWRSIGEELGQNANLLKKKWKNLRDSYAKHARRTVSFTKDRKKQKELLCKWKWANEMEPLRPYVIAPYPGPTGQENSGADNSDYDIDNTTTSRSVVRRKKTTSFHNSSVSPRNIAKVKYSNRLRTAPNTDSSPKNVITYLDNQNLVQSDNKKMDAVDMIFSGYASTVKTFSQRMQIMAKLKFAEVMSQLELENEQESATSSDQIVQEVNNTTYDECDFSSDVKENIDLE